MNCPAIISQLSPAAAVCQPTDRNLAFMAVAVGISLLVVAAMLQGTVATRTDFIATYRSSMPGDFSIEQRVTEFIDPSSANNLLLMSIVGGVGGALLVTAALISYYRLRSSQEELAEAKRGDDQERVHTLRERVKAEEIRLAVLVPLAIFCATLCVGSTLLYTKSTDVTFVGDTYSWDARYIWTYCGGWVQSGSLYASAINPGLFGAIQKAGAIIAGIGVGGGIFYYAARHFSKPKHSEKGKELEQIN